MIPPRERVDLAVRDIRICSMKADLTFTFPEYRVDGAFLSTGTLSQITLRE